MNYELGSSKSEGGDLPERMCIYATTRFIDDFIITIRRARPERGKASCNCNL